MQRARSGGFKGGADSGERPTETTLVAFQGADESLPSRTVDLLSPELPLVPAGWLRNNFIASSRRRGRLATCFCSAASKLFCDSCLNSKLENMPTIVLHEPPLRLSQALVRKLALEALQGRLGAGSWLSARARSSSLAG